MMLTCCNGVTAIDIFVLINASWMQPLVKICTLYHALTQLFTPCWVQHTFYTCSGYWQMEEKIHSISLWNVAGAFVRPKGITLNLKWPSEVENAVLVGLVREECLMIQHVSSFSFKEHLVRLNKVFQALCAGFQLKLFKCHLALKQVKYLGHIVWRMIQHLWGTPFPVIPSSWPGLSNYVLQEI